MTPAHVHLALNHVPVLGVGFGLLVLVAAMAWKRADIARAAFGLFVLAAAAAIPTYLSGEPAEAVVERFDQAASPWVEPHEKAAGVSLVLVEALGAVALAVLWLYRRQSAFAQPVLVAAVLFAAVTAGSLAWTANLGGQIRHAEIRGGASPPVAIDHDDDRRR